MSSIKIQYVNLSTQWENERFELLPIIENVMSSGQFVSGEGVNRFEKKAAEFCGTRYCVSLNSGTDALICGLMALGVSPGDEVITPPNSFIASTAAIVHLKAKPVFVDVLQDQNIDPNLIEKAITSKTKAIMPVHLTGRVAEMDEILQIANHYKIPIIEDAAQSIGSQLSGQKSGSFGEIGCFSTHPLKNLNACGDGGFLTTNDASIAKKVSLCRNHGLVNRDTVERFGFVSRMDVLQANILEYRLLRLSDVIEKRRKNAEMYRKVLKSNYIYVPDERDKELNTYHTFVIQCERRDELRNFLKNKGIETAIHYPIPIHLQPASAFLGYRKGDFPITEAQTERILTLPIHQYIQENTIQEIAEIINSFFENHADRD